MRGAELSLAAGAHGVTVHPRPDERHIRPADVYELADYLRRMPGIEFNIEGNPFPDFVELVRAAKPDQCTLVPDSVEAATSDHGWNVEEHAGRLGSAIAEFRDLGIRVSLFMDADSDQWRLARELGADRVERTRNHLRLLTPEGTSKHRWQPMPRPQTPRKPPVSA
jgi:pyridoxine 5-phosphate synthase